MHIVVVDGATLNPGDLNWEPLGEFGTYDLYPRSTAAEARERCRTAEGLITNKVVIDRALLEQAPNLRYIGVSATGFNIIDLETARARSVMVTNVPTYGTASVAQMVFALLLELTQHVGHHAATVKAGRWSQSPDFCYWDYPLIELEGKTLGIIGCGRIGQATAKLGAAFGMSVLGYDALAFSHPDITPVGLEDLLAQSDVVSLHCPLTPATEGLINRSSLARMKHSAFLINTSRGPLVVEDDLAAALNSGHLAGAGLDVLAVEPPPADHPLFSAPNCLITPHIAWATHSARQRLMNVLLDNIRGYLAGQPRNVVS